MNAGSENQHLARLRQEQEKTLSETDLQISKHEKFKSDYSALRERLLTLPNQITHDVMVPFGSFAFMPGRLVHTNELLVLLGDNYFLECSAHQAAEIVTRRLKELDEKIAQLQQQKKLLIPRADFTQELLEMSAGEGNVVEIREEYDEEKEQQWRAERAEHVRRVRQQENQKSLESSGKRDKGSAGILTDDDLMKRLEELEMQEHQCRELENMPDSQVASGATSWSVGSPCQSPATQNTLPGIKRGDYDDDDDVDSGDDGDEEEVDEDVGDEESGTEVSVPDKVIRFFHMNMDTSGDKVSGRHSPSFDSDKNDEVIINSPADIYKLVQNRPSSILKNRHKNGASKQPRGLEDDSAVRADSSRRKMVTFEDILPASKKESTVESDMGRLLEDSNEERNYAGGHMLTGARGDGDTNAAPKAFTDTVMETTKKKVSREYAQGPDGEGSAIRKEESTRPMSRFKASRQKPR